MSKTQAEIYKDSTINENDLATDSVTTPKIKDENVTRSKLSNDVKPSPFTTRGFNLPI
jgi:hypothetical protein